MRADIHTAHTKETRKRYEILRGICQEKKPFERYADIKRAVYEMDHTNNICRRRMNSNNSG